MENKVYEFVYSECIYEGGAATISIHRTRKGAEKAMEIHKEERRKEWIEDNLRDPELYHEFGDMEFWGIVETELLD